MNISGIHIAAPNLCTLCVDAWNGGNGEGRLYNYYSEMPQRFVSQYDALKKIDDLCDRLNYPQAAEQPRSFAKAAAAPVQRKKVEKCMSKDKLLEPRGKMATFVVHVMYRQNATWQGSVTWAEKDQKANFRSALELIKLMDSAVESTLPPEEPEKGGDDQ